MPQSNLESRVTTLEELVTYQEQTIEALDGVVLELRATLEELNKKVGNLLTSGQPGAPPQGRQAPDAPGIDPEAPPHY